jgi:hypothetical protein
VPSVSKTGPRVPPQDVAPAVSSVLAHAFAPVHKLALGVAVGFTGGALVALVTAYHVIARPLHAPPIELLSQYFYGYEISWFGVAVGFFWTFVAGFAAGWFAGFARNFLLATWLLVVRTRSALSQPFLDHI